MYKSENQLTWEHFSGVIMELREICFGNREHINKHIQSTEKAMNYVFAF